MPFLSYGDDNSEIRHHKITLCVRQLKPVVNVQVSVSPVSPILSMAMYRYRYRRYFLEGVSLSVSAILFSAVSVSIIADTFRQYR